MPSAIIGDCRIALPNRGSGTVWYAHAMRVLFAALPACQAPNEGTIDSIKTGFALESASPASITQVLIGIAVIRGSRAVAIRCRRTNL